MPNQTKIRAFFRLLDKIESYSRIERKLAYDMMCCAPEDGLDRAGEEQTLIAGQLYRLTHSKKYFSLLEELHANPEELTPLQKRAVSVRYEQYQKEKNISPKLAMSMTSASNRAYARWLSAKEKSDFSLFRDSLDEVAELTRKIIALRDHQPGSLYDVCLDDYEKGGSTKQLDGFFSKLREGIVPLMKRILADGKPIRRDFLSESCPIPLQEQFSRFLMETEGLRMSAVTLGTTEHPFTDAFCLDDVRITTHYYENLFFSNAFSTMHEGGHALFGQYEPREFEENHVAGLMTSAMHECISRFYENIIGRSEAFIHYIYPKLCDLLPDIMKNVSERELYEGVNIAEPSLIRTEADELTYSLHILVRYEIEKDLVNGLISAKDVPALWNRKYKEYLGVDVPNDTLGCLQDVHWTDSFGYFPSYALGNAYSVQILRTMEKQMDVWGRVAQGDLIGIRDWLAENVFSKASLMDPDEWIRSITGEPLIPDYYLDYLKEKYTRLYGLK